MLLRLAFFLIISYNAFGQQVDVITKLNFFKGVWHVRCADLGIVNFDNYKSRSSIKQKKQVHQMISLLNSFGKNFQDADSLLVLTKNMEINSDTIGLLHRERFHFYNGLYSGYGIVSSINNIITYKFIQVDFNKKIEGYDSLKRKRDTFLDYKLVEDFLPQLQSSETLDELFDHFAIFKIDTTYTKRLDQFQADTNSIVFNTSSKDSLDAVLFRNIASLEAQGFYSPVCPSKDILNIIKTNKIELLFELLKSYNYCAQISAMEALWYLSLKGVIKIDDETKQWIKKN